MKLKIIRILLLIFSATNAALNVLTSALDKDAIMLQADNAIAVVPRRALPIEHSPISSTIRARNDEPQMVSEKDLFALCWKWQGHPKLLDEFIAKHFPSPRGQEFSQLLRESSPRPISRLTDMVIDDILYELQVDENRRRKFLAKINANIGLRVFLSRRMQSYAIRRQPDQPKEQQQQQQKHVKKIVGDNLSTVTRLKKVAISQTNPLSKVVYYPWTQPKGPMNPKKSDQVKQPNLFRQTKQSQGPKQEDTVENKIETEMSAVSGPTGQATLPQTRPINFSYTTQKIPYKSSHGYGVLKGTTKKHKQSAAPRKLA